jgi:hypothetical protein
MYNALIQWIGSKTCNAAGDLSTVLDAGTACASGQLVNVGLVVLGLFALSVIVMVINARRRQRRDNNYL